MFEILPEHEVTVYYVKVILRPSPVILDNVNSDNDIERHKFD
jgi:hypothetical protein